MKQGLIIDDYYTKRWYKDDKLHREDGPAMEYADGFKQWFMNGETHRLDGPAVYYTDGSKEWFYKDTWIKEVKSQEEFEEWLKYKTFL